MLTFGFEDGSYLVLSVEPRPEAGEGYAPISSFFKAFELVYTFADERDLIARALGESGGNVSEAARRLATDRANLHRRMRRLGMSR